MSDPLGCVGTIVKHQHHRIRSPCLLVQSSQAGSNPFGLVPRRDGDNSAASHERTAPSSVFLPTKVCFAGRWTVAPRLRAGFTDVLWRL
jgi:hypothetical protein